MASPFKKIIEEAFEAAEAVDCSPDEYHAGLVLMWHMVQERCEAEGVDPKDPEILEQVHQMEEED